MSHFDFSSCHVFGAEEVDSRIEVKNIIVKNGTKIKEITVSFLLLTE